MWLLSVTQLRMYTTENLKQKQEAFHINIFLCDTIIQILKMFVPSLRVDNEIYNVDYPASNLNVSIFKQKLYRRSLYLIIYIRK